MEAVSRGDRKGRLEQTLSRVAGRPIRVDFEVVPQQPRPAAQVAPPPTQRQRLRQAEQHAFVKEAIELFGGEVLRVDPPITNRPTAVSDEDGGVQTQE
ncbi:MAG: hypothetical protein J5I93_02725 [Pirellulaceae bacterium]|nr:hypothetical protein [Pirellulaceae bacterium]